MIPCAHNDIHKFFEVEKCSRRLRGMRINEEGYAKYKEYKLNKHTLLSGFFQSWRYFSKNIKSKLKFRKHIINAARLQIPTNKVTVGIHIRHTHQFEVNYLRFPPKHYFNKVMERFKTIHGDNVTFIIASDDIKWCEANFKSVTIIRNSPEVDMAALSLCDHHVISVGSFGWWSAFFGTGKVFYYKNEMKLRHITNKNNVVLSDYYPPNWIEVI